MPYSWEHKRTRIRTDKTMQTIAICNQKGGVGKTTTSLCLTAGLSERGKKCLLIDLEGQRNLTATLRAEDKLTALEVLIGEATAKEAITETAIGDFIAGDKRLSSIDAIINKLIREGIFKEEALYTSLRDALKPLKRSYDIIVVDTPPSLGTLTMNALTASDFVIVPCEADYYSLQGLTDLAETIEAVKGSLNKKLRTMGVLLTKHSARYTLSKEIQETLTQLTEAFDTEVFDTYIRHSQKAREAQFKAQGLLRYAPKSTIATDYRAFTEEVLHKLE